MEEDIRDSVVAKFSGTQSSGYGMRLVDLVDLARDGGSVEGELDAAGLPRLSTMLTAPMGRIRYRLQGRIDEQGRPGIGLQLEGRLGLTCDLCGGRLDWSLDESSGYFFVDDETQVGALPITAEGDEPLVASRRFDVQDLVEEQAILALPISPRHAECEQRVRAAQPEQGTTRPFSVLASLKRGRTDIQ
jgi:uncharacterized protein